MLWYLIEDYYIAEEKYLLTKVNNYDRLEIYLINIHTLLSKNMKNYKNLLTLLLKKITKI